MRHSLLLALVAALMSTAATADNLTASATYEFGVKNSSGKTISISPTSGGYGGYTETVGIGSNKRWTFKSGDSQRTMWFCIKGNCEFTATMQYPTECTLQDGQYLNLDLTSKTYSKEGKEITVDEVACGTYEPITDG
jgi:hypothetical protein